MGCAPVPGCAVERELVKGKEEQIGTSQEREVLTIRRVRRC